MKKYELGDELTAINGGLYNTEREFTGTVVGFTPEGDYLVTYEYGWALYSAKKTLHAFNVDNKYLGTKMWHVPKDAIKKTEEEIRAEREPSNQLMSHLVTASSDADGNHAECYPHPKSRKKVLLATNCPARRIMAKRKFPDSKYFPKPRVAGKLGKVNVYEMEKYVPYHRGANKLSEVDKKIFFQLAFKFDQTLEGLKRLKMPEIVKRDIIKAYNAIKREGYTPKFDICDHNMMVSPKGQLIFTDLFWVDKKEYQ